MAAEYATMKYANGMTYGNVAYDLGRVIPEYEVPQQERVKKERKEREAVRIEA